MFIQSFHKKFNDNVWLSKKFTKRREIDFKPATAYFFEKNGKNAHNVSFSLLDNGTLLEADLVYPKYNKGFILKHKVYTDTAIIFLSKTRITQGFTITDDFDWDMFFKNLNYKGKYLVLNFYFLPQGNTVTINFSTINGESKLWVDGIMGDKITGQDKFCFLSNNNLQEEDFIFGTDNHFYFFEKGNNICLWSQKGGIINMQPQWIKVLDSAVFMVDAAGWQKNKKTIKIDEIDSSYPKNTNLNFYPIGGNNYLSSSGIELSGKDIDYINNFIKQNQSRGYLDHIDFWGTNYLFYEEIENEKRQFIYIQNYGFLNYSEIEYINENKYCLEKSNFIFLPANNSELFEEVKRYKKQIVPDLVEVEVNTRSENLKNLHKTVDFMGYSILESPDFQKGVEINKEQLVIFKSSKWKNFVYFFNKQTKKKENGIFYKFDQSLNSTDTGDRKNELFFDLDLFFWFHIDEKKKTYNIDLVYIDDKNTMLSKIFFEKPIDTFNSQDIINILAFINSNRYTNSNLKIFKNNHQILIQIYFDSKTYIFLIDKNKKMIYGDIIAEKNFKNGIIKNNNFSAFSIFLPNLNNSATAGELVFTSIHENTYDYHFLPISNKGKVLYHASYSYQTDIGDFGNSSLLHLQSSLLIGSLQYNYDNFFIKHILHNTIPYRKYTIIDIDTKKLPKNNFLHLRDSNRYIMTNQKEILDIGSWEGKGKETNYYSLPNRKKLFPTSLSTTAINLFTGKSNPQILSLFEVIRLHLKQGEFQSQVGHTNSHMIYGFGSSFVAFDGEHGSAYYPILTLKGIYGSQTLLNKNRKKVFIGTGKRKKEE